MAATPSSITGFAVAEQIRVYIQRHALAGFVAGHFDGQHKLDDTLAGARDGVAAPQIAVTPGAELPCWTLLPRAYIVFDYHCN